jgi:hypothetical protein
MAFNTNANSNKPAADKGENDNWKATGFLNFYLPTQDGKRRKLGSIPLKQSEKDLLAWLTEDPSRVKIIMSKLILEYQAAEQAAGTGFDLSIPEDAPAGGDLPE